MPAPSPIRGFALIALLVVVIIIGLLNLKSLSFLGKPPAETPEEKQYAAWCVAAKRKNLTIAEWRALREAGLLPEAEAGILSK